MQLWPGTFLRSHIEHMLWAGANEVLALRSFAAELEGRKGMDAAALDPQAIRRKLLAGFFADKPDLVHLYLPIGLVGLDVEGKPQWDCKAKNLCDLVGMLDQAGDRSGILLTAASGAGKTTAALACFHAAACGRLGEYVPCWLGSADSFTGELTDVRSLILRAAGLPHEPAQWAYRALEHWLKLGPPLLLLVDLNLVPAKVQVTLAESLLAFQRDWGDKGHRLVVTYRSAGLRTAVLNTLRENDAFRPWDLLELDQGQVRDYLDNLVKFKRWMLDELGLPGSSPASTPDPRLRQVLDRLLTESERGLISRPLLAHFVSELSVEKLDEVHTSLDLFQAVVDQHLARDLKNHAGQLPEAMRDTDNGRRIILSLLTRVALAMARRTKQDAGQIDTSLSWEEYETLVGWRYPAKQLPSWCPRKRFWTQQSLAEGYTQACPYYGNRRLKEWGAKPGPELAQGLLQFSLLRRDGASVRFLHDAFIGFFVGLYGLRLYKEPQEWTLAELHQQPLDEGWYAKAAARLAKSPHQWLVAARPLGQSLSAEQKLGLAVELLCRPTPEGLVQLLEGVVGPCGQDREPGEAWEVLERLRLGLESQQAALRETPQALRAWLGGVLGPGQGTVSQSLAERIHASMDREGRPWLQRINPVILGGGTLVTQLPVRISCMAKVDAHHVVIGTDNGEVLLLALATGKSVQLAAHEGIVASLVLTNDGRVVSAGYEDGRVLVSQLAHPGVYIEVARHERHGLVRPILLRISDARHVVSAGSDGRVLVSPLDMAGASLEVDRHDLWIPVQRYGQHVATKENWGSCVRVLELTRDGRAVTGGDTGQVRVCPLNRAGAGIQVAAHSGPVSALALVSGERVLSAGRDGRILVSLINRTDSAVELAKHETPVVAMQVTADAVVVSGDHRGQVLATLIDWPGVTFPLAQHTNEIVGLALVADGRIVSGSQSGLILLSSLDGMNTNELRESHGSALIDLRCDNGCVVLCYHDGRVFASHLDAGQPLAEISRHDGPVSASIFLDRDRLVTAGRDGRVLLSSLSGRDPDALLGIVRHAGTVELVKLTGDARIVSAGGSPCARVVVSSVEGSDAGLEVSRHEGFCHQIELLPSGHVMSLGWDCRLLVSPLDRSDQSRPVAQNVSVFHLLGDGRAVLGQCDGAVVVSSLTGEGRAIEIARHKGPVAVLEVTDDGRVISGAGRDDGRVLVSCLDEPGVGLEVARHDRGVYRCAVLEDRVVSGGGKYDCSVQVSALNRSGSSLQVMRHSPEVSLLAVASGGRVLSGGGQELAIWTLCDSTVRVQKIEGVSTVGEHKCGDLVIGFWDGRVMVWPTQKDTETRTVLRQIAKHSSAVLRVICLEDRWVLSAGQDRMLLVAPLTGGVVACQAMESELTTWCIRDRTVAFGMQNGCLAIYHWHPPTGMMLS